jgi:hypothetical protein
VGQDASSKKKGEGALVCLHAGAPLHPCGSGGKSSMKTPLVVLPHLGIGRRSPLCATYKGFFTLLSLELLHLVDFKQSFSLNYFGSIDVLLVNVLSSHETKQTAFRF